jgi:hypothetical protein
MAGFYLFSGLLISGKLQKLSGSNGDEMFFRNSDDFHRNASKTTKNNKWFKISRSYILR